MVLVMTSSPDRFRLAACSVGIAVAALTIVRGQPAATLSVEQLLGERLGISSADIARFTGGDTVVWPVAGASDREVAAAGALRAKGDLRRITAWLRDIEAFIRAAGTENVGAIANPATDADVAKIKLDDADWKTLQACKPGRCDIRVPVTFLQRLQKEVTWNTADARNQAAAVTRSMVAEYVRAYQSGGDAGLGAFEDRANANKYGMEFQDMLRRSTKVWDLAYPFVSYLESFPKAAPAGTESRFYWTRDQVGRNPTLTLHHVVLQELPAGRILVADKQFYASRQIDAALMIALGIPNADHTSFDLLVSIKARAESMGGVAAKVLRGRIEKEVREGLAVYLDWIRGSAAL